MLWKSFICFHLTVYDRRISLIFWDSWFMAKVVYGLSITMSDMNFGRGKNCS